METHVSILRRVGIALLAYVVVRTVGLIIDFATGASHSITIDLMSTILGVLLIRGSLGAARWLAFLSAFEIVATLLAFVVGVPLTLVLAPGVLAGLRFDSEIIWPLVAIVLDVAFALWVLRELTDPIVEERMAAAGRGSIRRAQKWGIGAALVLTAVMTALFVPVMIMWPRWTAPAVAAAHRQLGDDWQVSVRSYTSTSRHGWRAHVVARRGDEVRELDVGGQ